MSPTWRWCLKIGAMIVVIDLIALALSWGQPAASDLRGIVLQVDLLANIWLCAFVGYRTGRETGRVTASAEAGLMTVTLPAIVSSVRAIVLPDPILPVDPLATLVIGSIALNVAIGGVSAWLAGLIASRGRKPIR